MDFVISYISKNEPLTSVQLVRGSFLSKYFLQNPYFNTEPEQLELDITWPMLEMYFELFLYSSSHSITLCGLSVSELRSEPRAHWSHVQTICNKYTDIQFVLFSVKNSSNDHHLFSRFWADTDGWKEIDYSVRQFFFIFACTNSCVNPLIYGAFTDRNTGLFVSKERLCFMPIARKRRWRVSN